MTMPTPGDLVVKFNRTYKVVNPNLADGPPTYRLSNPDEVDSGERQQYNYTGDMPIDVDILPADGPTPITVNTSMDFNQLEERTG